MIANYLITKQIVARSSKKPASGTISQLGCKAFARSDPAFEGAIGHTLLICKGRQMIGERNMNEYEESRGEMEKSVTTRIRVYILAEKSGRRRPARHWHTPQIHCCKLRLQRRTTGMARPTHKPSFRLFYKCYSRLVV